MNQESSLRKTWNILVPFLVYFAAHDLSQVLLAFLMNLSLLRLGGAYKSFMLEHAVTVNGVLNAAALFIGMAFVWPMARREFQWAKQANAAASGKTQTQGQEERERAHIADITYTASLQLLRYGLLIFFAVSLALGTNILLSLTGITEKSETYQRIAGSQYGVAFGVGLIIYGVLSPLAEETVFRGLIYNRLKRYFPVGISIAACGILFGVYHGNPVQGLYGCILGLAITFMYERYQSFAAPVLFHAAANISVFAAGYRQELFHVLIAPKYAVLFLLLSALCLFGILSSQLRNS